MSNFYTSCLVALISLLVSTLNAQTLLPLMAGSPIEPGVDYFSANGRYVLQFQNDGNLVVYTAGNHGYVWGFNETDLPLNSVGGAYLSEQGRLTFTDENGSPLQRFPRFTAANAAQLEITDAGVLRIVDAGERVIWASNGIYVEDIDPLPALRADVEGCKRGITLLQKNLYRYPNLPDSAAADRRAWVEVLTVFREDHEASCAGVGKVLQDFPEEAFAASVRGDLSVAGFPTFEATFTGESGGAHPRRSTCCWLSGWSRTGHRLHRHRRQGLQPRSVPRLQRLDGSLP